MVKRGKKSFKDQHLELSKKIESALKSAKNILRNDAFSVPGKIDDRSLFSIRLSH
jgi:hypothetical protein